MKLSAIPCGTIAANFSGDPEFVPSPMPIMAFLVETGGEVVLFDTGMHPVVRTDAVGYWGRIARRRLVPDLPEQQDVVSRLAEVGMTPDDVTVVINSHLHNDHAGMNRFFPNSRVLVRQREWDYAITVMDEDSSGFVRGDFYDEDNLPELFEYDDECDLFGTGDLVLISTPGHTPGHQSAAIRFGSGATHVLTGDAVYSADDLVTLSPPTVYSDRDAAVESVKRLAALRDGGSTIHVCHDPSHWAGITAVRPIHEE